MEPSELAKWMSKNESKIGCTTGMCLGTLFASGTISAGIFLAVTQSQDSIATAVGFILGIGICGGAIAGATGNFLGNYGLLFFKNKTNDRTDEVNNIHKQINRPA